MGNPTAQTLGLINASVGLGGLFFAAPSAFIADRFGRRLAVFLSMVLFLTGSILNSSAKSLGVFIGGRVLVGAGIAAVNTCAPVLCQELAHPRMRGTVASLYNVSFNIGAIAVTWLAYGTSFLDNSNQWAWRIPTMAQIAPAAFVMLVLPWIPESPRWLVANGKSERAHQILARYHANGDLDDELVLFQVDEIHTEVDRDRQHTHTWVQAFSKGANRRRFTVLWLVSVVTNWNGKAIVTYYLSSVLKLIGITAANQVTGFNAGIQVFNFFATVIGAGFTESLGRKHLWQLALLVMLVANILQTVFSAVYAHHPSFGVGKGVIFAVFLYSFGFDLGCNPLLFTYETEIMPFYLRSKGVAWGVTWNNIFGTAAQYANPIGLQNLGWKFYLVYTALLVCFLFIVHFLFIETRGKTLEEIQVMFENDVPRSAFIKPDNPVPATNIVEEVDTKSGEGDNEAETDLPYKEEQVVLGGFTSR